MQATTRQNSNVTQPQITQEEALQQVNTAKNRLINTKEYNEYARYRNNSLNLFEELRSKEIKLEAEISSHDNEYDSLKKEINFETQKLEAKWMLEANELFARIENIFSAIKSFDDELISQYQCIQPKTTDNKVIQDNKFFESEVASRVHHRFKECMINFHGSFGKLYDKAKDHFAADITLSIEEIRQQTILLTNICESNQKIAQYLKAIPKNKAVEIVRPLNSDLLPICNDKMLENINLLKNRKAEIQNTSLRINLLFMQYLNQFEGFSYNPFRGIVDKCKDESWLYVYSIDNRLSGANAPSTDLKKSALKKGTELTCMISRHLEDLSNQLELIWCIELTKSFNITAVDLQKMNVNWKKTITGIDDNNEIKGELKLASDVDENGKLLELINTFESATNEPGKAFEQARQKEFDHLNSLAKYLPISTGMEDGLETIVHRELKNQIASEMRNLENKWQKHATLIIKFIDDTFETINKNNKDINEIIGLDGKTTIDQISEEFISKLQYISNLTKSLPDHIQKEIHQIKLETELLDKTDTDLARALKFLHEQPPVSVFPKSDLEKEAGIPKQVRDLSDKHNQDRWNNEEILRNRKTEIQNMDGRLIQILNDYFRISLNGMDENFKKRFENALNDLNGIA